MTLKRYSTHPAPDTLPHSVGCFASSSMYQLSSICIHLGVRERGIESKRVSGRGSERERGSRVSHYINKLIYSPHSHTPHSRTPHCHTPHCHTPLPHMHSHCTQKYVPHTRCLAAYHLLWGPLGIEWHLVAGTVYCPVYQASVVHTTGPRSTAVSHTPLVWYTPLVPRSTPQCTQAHKNTYHWYDVWRRSCYQETSDRVALGGWHSLRQCTRLVWYTGTIYGSVPG